MYVAEPREGLGVWAQAALIGATLVSEWIRGDGHSDIPNDIYYPEAKVGIVHCAGPWNVESVEEALQHISPSDPLIAEARQYFVSGVAQRDADKWARYGRPGTPLALAGGLVAEAHGGSDCQTGPPAAEASGIVRRILAREEARQADMARAREVAAAAAARAAQAAGSLVQGIASGQPVLTGVVPGGVSPLALALGGGVLLFLVVRR